MDNLGGTRKKSNVWQWICIAIAIVAVIIITILITLLVTSNKNNNSGRSASNDSRSSADNKQSNDTSNKAAHPIKTKEPLNDKTFFIKDYVSLNAKDTCTWRLNGYCMDSYGTSDVKMNFITTDGTVVDEYNMSNYQVTGQNIEPNTQLNVGEWGSPSIGEISLNVKTIDPNKKVQEVEKTENMLRASCTDKGGTELKVVDPGNGQDYTVTVSCKYIDKVLK